MGIVGVMLALFFREIKNEYSVLIGMVVAVTIFCFVILKVEQIVTYLNTVQDLLIIDKRYVTILLKMLGVTYVAEFAVDICQDAGYATVAHQIEIYAKVSILLLSMPVLMAFVEAVGEFL